MPYCVYIIWLSVDAIDLGRLVGYLTPSHVTHQRLLLQFLSAPEDGRKERPKHVEQYCNIVYSNEMFCQSRMEDI